MLIECQSGITMLEISGFSYRIHNKVIVNDNCANTECALVGPGVRIKSQDCSSVFTESNVGFRGVQRAVAKRRGLHAFATKSVAKAQARYGCGPKPKWPNREGFQI